MVPHTPTHKHTHTLRMNAASNTQIGVRAHARRELLSIFVFVLFFWRANAQHVAHLTRTISHWKHYCFSTPPGVSPSHPPSPYSPFTRFVSCDFGYVLCWFISIVDSFFVCIAVLAMEGWWWWWWWPRSLTRNATETLYGKRQRRGWKEEVVV